MDLSPIKYVSMIDEIDKSIIRFIQGDIPLVSRPFKLMSSKIGISEEEFISRIKRLRQRNILRRFGATLRHQIAGFSANAMVAWVVPEKRIEEIGNLFSQFKEVTHCYQRPSFKDWPYNLYTMIHADTRERCYEIAKRMSEASGIKEYVLLFSEREYKKTSMRYF